jgi:hypothetical protein
MAHSCSEPFYGHAASRSTAKAKLIRCRRIQTIALASAALRGHGARKKINSHFMSHFVQLLLHQNTGG